MPNPESSIDWDLVSELLSEALRRPRDKRDSWVDRQPGASAATAAEVKSLLRAEEHHQALSVETLGRKSDAVADTGEVTRARFGPYKTLRILGRGGMGVVYLAQRADGEFDQTVALKVIAAPFSSQDFVNRFRTERQLLAGLTHPNITRLLDGGVTAEGDPYLAMEFVDGAPLDRFCDSARLNIPARLDLLLQLCDAVDFAHRNLILHRDLKPSNVLVTADGVVKLLDFGTAGLIPPSGAQAQITRARMLTPRYASPAQLRAERSSISDDVFSLGVIFYELLTGAWPFGDPDSMAGELKRATTDAPAAPLTAGITAQTSSLRGCGLPSLSRMLRGDLSAIALKALENDAHRRYATVAQFAADIRRYLEGRPVEARPQTTAYRAAKFLRRRWLPVASATLLISSVFASAIIATRAASSARAEARKAAEVNRFLTGMLASAGQTRFDPARYTVAEMLDASSVQLEKHPPADARTTAVLHLSLARSYVPLARWDQVEFHTNRAVPVFRAIGDQVDLADSLGMQGFADTAEGRYESAIARYRQALDIYRQLGKQAPSDAAFDTKTSYAELLSLMTNRGLAETKPLYDELLAAGAHDASIPRTMLARAMADWGLALADEGRYGDAESVLRNALSVGRQEDPGAMWETAPLLRLAWLYSKQRRWAEGAEAGRRMLEISQSIVGPDSVDTANARLVWARNAVMIGQKEPAAQAVRMAMPIIEKAAPAGSLNLWSAARNAALVLSNSGYCVEAERYARESLSAAEAAHLDAKDPRPAESWQSLGEALECRGRKSDALEAFNHAAGIFERAPPLWSPELADVRADIARLVSH